MYEFKFADIGEGIHEGEVLAWHVNINDSVKKDQVVVEVMTEKVTVEITSPVTGIIRQINFAEGDIVKVGQTMFVVDENGMRVDASTTPAKAASSKSLQETSIATSPNPVVEAKETDDSLFVASERVKRKRIVESPPRVESSGSASLSGVSTSIINERPLASPAVRRAAREKGIDLRFVRGTGPGGRITREDFMNSVSAQTTGSIKPSIVGSTVEIPTDSEKRIPLRGVRRAISEKMSKSRKMAAHFSYFDEFDMTALEELRKSAKALGETRGIKITYLPFIIKAIIASLKEFPQLNASLDDENQEIIIKGYYNIGVAVDTPSGLMVPNVKNADKKSLWQLAVEIKDLAERARTGKLKLDEITGGSFTITNVGPIGGLMSTPIINWPEVAIIGIHRGKLRPVVIEKDGKPEIAIRRMMYVSISVDHRVCDGADAARFMNRVIGYLENPALLLLED
ncbi:MAG: dihydrolipoamide acetyltransferase family protein [Candidatus Hodarchaeota archaeon]